MVAIETGKRVTFSVIIATVAKKNASTKSWICYVVWNLFTGGSLQFCNNSTIASLEANQHTFTDKAKLTWLDKH